MSTPLRRWSAAISFAAIGTLALASVPQNVNAATPSATPATHKHHTGHQRPTKVVVIVVDALSKQIVERYGMKNVQRLMATGVDTPNGYLGHLGSITVVTHNVITTGVLPKHMGWSSDGYRDVKGVLADQPKQNDSDMWLTSDWTKDQFFAVQKAAGYPKLADYLHKAQPGSKVFAISPKAYAGYGLGGPSADSIITFSGRNYDCDGAGKVWRGPDGVNVPSYLSAPQCGRFYVNSSSKMTYDTWKSPARLYPLDGDRYTAGLSQDHQGGDVWAADAAVEVIKHEPKWSGITVTLPGVDKSAHMWGGVDDHGAEGADGTPITHMADATKIADAQVGKVIDALKAKGELDNTLVVLTADHGSTPARQFNGIDDGSADRGYNNWYYGAVANGSYLSPQPAVQPLVATGNVAELYNDSMLSVWLKDRSPAKVAQAVALMRREPNVTAVWQRTGDRFRRVTPVNWSQMSGKAERQWFNKHAQELLNTAASESGPDLIATLPDYTAYDVAGSHGGIQRNSQQIPIVFAGADLSSKDLRGPVRSTDILPTILRAMDIKTSVRLDGVAWKLPTK